MTAFKMAAFALEMFAPLRVDRPGNNIGEMTGILRGIIRSRNAYGFDTDHPA